MKNKVMLISFLVLASLMMFFANEKTAFAAETMKKGVNITIIVPDAMPKPTPATPDTPTDTPKPTVEPITVYPRDITETRENGGRQIVKTYELNADESPAQILQIGFERGGWRFSLTDIVRTETTNIEKAEHKETITISTDTKDVGQILPQLSPTLDYQGADGFCGVLVLDISSVTVAEAGTKTTSHTMTVTREYPRLSSNDTSVIAKTVNENGKTYTLADIEWRSAELENIDHSDFERFYTAIAKYTATGYSTKVTGYVTTAEYDGTVERRTAGKTVYSAIFEGEEIIVLSETPLETPSETPAPTPTPIESAAETSRQSDEPIATETHAATESVEEMATEAAPTEESTQTEPPETSEPTPTTEPTPTAEPTATAGLAPTTAVQVTEQPTAAPTSVKAETGGTGNGDGTQSPPFITISRNAALLIIAAFALIIAGLSFFNFKLVRGDFTNKKTVKDDESGGDTGADVTDADSEKSEEGGA